MNNEYLSDFRLKSKTFSLDWYSIDVDPNVFFIWVLCIEIIHI